METKCRFRLRNMEYFDWKVEVKEDIFNFFSYNVDIFAIFLILSLNVKAFA